MKPDDQSEAEFRAEGEQLLRELEDALDDFAIMYAARPWPWQLLTAPFYGPVVMVACVMRWAARRALQRDAEKHEPRR